MCRHFIIVQTLNGFSHVHDHTSVLTPSHDCRCSIHSPPLPPYSLIFPNSKRKSCDDNLDQTPEAPKPARQKKARKVEKVSDKASGKASDKEIRGRARERETEEDTEIGLIQSDITWYYLVLHDVVRYYSVAKNNIVLGLRLLVFVLCGAGVGWFRESTLSVILFPNSPVWPLWFRVRARWTHDPQGKNQETY